MTQYCIVKNIKVGINQVLFWRTWRQYQKNKDSHNILTNSLSNSIQHISTSSAIQTTIIFNTLNYYSELNNDYRNEIDFFNANEIDSFNANKMNFFDDQNKMNFDVAKLNIMESSSVKNNSLSQECSKNNNSKQSDNIIQNIEEEIDIDKETDKDYNKITPSLSNINNLDIFSKLSYNPIHILYNPLLLKENYIT
ncbi:25705_t:CDS:2 [Dentiscutata erythropus]|uniref:25705_t:CDS:1 n=1 Tax=Dentiscutata erythropus TaxID=1348616 RepID=A0A9N9DVG4_9GLOM|nr:25705_t:CDS:2 [Dentiscutata erythropus]